MFRKSLIVPVNFLIRQRTLKPYLTTPRINGSNQQKHLQIGVSRAFSTSSPPDNLQQVHFEEFQKLLRDKDVVVIDVREPEELVEHGALPRAINIPLGQVETVLKNMPDKDFVEKFGQVKPTKETPIVFSCMRGIRSEKAQIATLELQYKNVKNYLGGWTEWAEKHKNS